MAEQNEAQTVENNEVVQFVTTDQLNVVTEHLKEQMALRKPEKATLFAKMAEVMAAVKRVPQNGWNSFHKYKYPTETDLLEAVREILAEAGLALMVSVEDSKRELLPIHDKYNPTDPTKTKMMWFTRIKVKFTLGCTDTGQTVESYFHGEGQDNDDKGLYKAYTNTMKYFLRQTFLIPTGDTVPESDGRPMDVEYDRQQPQNHAPQQNAGNRNQQPQNAPQGQEPPKNAITYEALVNKWILLGGTKENFKPFYDRNIKNGLNHADIDKWCNQKKIERDKAAEKNKSVLDEKSEETK